MTDRPVYLPSAASITAADRDRFFADGFAVVAQLVSPETVEQLRQAYDDIVAGRAQARGDRMLGDVIRQVKHPSQDHPVFRHNTAIDVGTALASALFRRTDMTKVYEMLIDKPAGTPHATPWHQDVGYLGRPAAPAGTPADVPTIQIWLALDAVDTDNGCMQFLPRPHGQPSLRHVVASGDPDDEGRLLAIDEPIDTDLATACPLQAGGCTIHLVGTPHFTGANHSTRPRRAYIFNIGPQAIAAAAEHSDVRKWERAIVDVMRLTRPSDGGRGHRTLPDPTTETSSRRACGGP